MNGTVTPPPWSMAPGMGASAKMQQNLVPSLLFASPSQFPMNSSPPLALTVPARPRVRSPSPCPGSKHGISGTPSPAIGVQSPFGGATPPAPKAPLIAEPQAASVSVVQGAMLGGPQLLSPSVLVSHSSGRVDDQLQVSEKPWSFLAPQGALDSPPALARDRSETSLAHMRSQTLAQSTPILRGAVLNTPSSSKPAIGNAAIANTPVSNAMVVRGPSMIRQNMPHTNTVLDNSAPHLSKINMCMSDPPMVSIPHSVLSHLEKVVSEMEQEVAEIQEAGKQPDTPQDIPCVDHHLAQLRSILADDLLRAREMDVERDSSKVTTLEADNWALRQQVQALEGQKTQVENQRDELLCIRTTLEAECESRLNDMKCLAEAVEIERHKASTAKEDLKQQMLVLSSESQILKEQQCLEPVKSELREIVTTCQTLQARVQELERDNAQLHRTVAERETEVKSKLERIAELEASISELRTEDASKLERIAELEATISELRTEDASKLDRIVALEATISEKTASVSQIGDEKKRYATMVTELETRSALKEEEAQKHRSQNDVHANRIRELEAARQSDDFERKEIKRKNAELERSLAEQRGIVEARDDGHQRQHTSLRNRIAELELQLTEFQVSDTSRNQQVTSHRTRIQELEQELLSTQAERDSHGRQLSTHKLRLKDLEQQLEDQQTGEEKHSKQHTLLSNRVQELEQTLAEARGCEANLSRQQSSQRTRIQALEEQLSEVQISHDSHARQCKELKRKNAELIEELESNRITETGQCKELRRKNAELIEELESNRITETDKVKQQKTHRAALADLEQQLVDVQSARDKHLHEVAMSRQRVGELEGDIEALRSSEKTYQRNQADHKARAAQLELEIGNRDSVHSMQTKEHKGRISELERECVRLEREVEASRMQLSESRTLIQDLESKRQIVDQSVVQSVDQRVDGIMKELSEEREAQKRLMSEVESVRKAANKVKSDADSLIEAQENRHNEVVAAKAREFAEKFHQLSQEKSRLESELGGLQRSDRESLIPSRKSLYGAVAPPISGALLPEISDDFVFKVRSRMADVDSAVADAGVVIRRCTNAQVEHLRRKKDVVKLRPHLNDYQQRSEIDAERRGTADLVDSKVYELKALREEVHVQHQLSENSRVKILERLEFEIERCRAELDVLRADSSLEEVPENALRMFLDFFDQGADAVWSDGFSPMHWAAREGRRDIIEYLLSLKQREGKLLLQSYDRLGYNPMYYAQLGKHKTLVEWLIESVGIDAPVHRLEQAPSFADKLSESYQKVLDQIRTHGWRSMSWKEGFTMLHWAASKGHADVCEYLVSIDADPSARDDKNRSPIDMAEAARNEHLVTLLQNLKISRRASRKG